MNPKDLKQNVYHDEYRCALQTLHAYKDAGISLFLEDRPVSPRKAAYVCIVRERGRYMSDFVTDDNGKLSEIRFDRVE